MSRFYELEVKEIIRETEDAVSIGLEIPKDLKEEFKYNHGQYLTFRKIIDGEDVRRSYSLCTSPLEDGLKVAVKRVEGGKFSTYANREIKKGDVLEVMPPGGRFTIPLDKNSANSYLLIAAGSGITPVISIVKTILMTEPNSEVTLFYGNKGFDSIIFREELEGLKNKFMKRFSLHHILSRESLGSPLYKGRITGEKCGEFNQHLMDFSKIDQFFVCGPEKMIHSVSDYLLSIGIEKSKIHFELFTASHGELNSLDKIDHSKEKEVEHFDSEVEVILDGDSFEFKVSSDGDSILDMAEKNGADVPFACKGGVCCTCKGKVLEGEVRMDVNYALEQDEVDNGYVLTCQSHPVSKKVVVSYDE